MVELDFTIEDARMEPHAIAPLLVFALRIANRTPSMTVLSVMLNCQIRIEPTRRSYAASEREKMSDLFGEPSRWGQTLRGFLWTHASLSAPAFDGECRIDLPATCSFDFNVAATKFFHGVEAGEVPLQFLFSGSAFFRDEQGNLQIAPISWNKESSFRLPIALWRSMMDRYYPQTAWLCLSRDSMERLYAYKRRRGLPSFDDALDGLLQQEQQGAAP